MGATGHKTPKNIDVLECACPTLGTSTRSIAMTRADVSNVCFSFK